MKREVLSISQHEIVKDEDENGCFKVLAEHHPHIGVYLKAFTLRDGSMHGVDLGIFLPAEAVEALGEYLVDCAILEELDPSARSLDEDESRTIR